MSKIGGTSKKNLGVFYLSKISRCRLVYIIGYLYSQEIIYICVRKMTSQLKIILIFVFYNIRKFLSVLLSIFPLEEKYVNQLMNHILLTDNMEIQHLSLFNFLLPLFLLSYFSSVVNFILSFSLLFFHFCYVSVKEEALYTVQRIKKPT